VTVADRGTEIALMERILRPNGRTTGCSARSTAPAADTASPWKWVVDPIDGTSNFVRGIPVWASLIALTHGSTARSSVWCGTCDGAAVVECARPRRVRVRTRWRAAAPPRLERERRGRGAGLRDVQRRVDQLGLTPVLVALQQRARRARGFGDFWQHMLVAEGAVDLAIDAVGVAPYDLAALMVVVEEAGGMFTDRHGARTYTSNTAVSSNGVLHGEIAALA
jgi:histidinol-phosphatase